jgi:hypothetical protein
MDGGTASQLIRGVGRTEGRWAITMTDEIAYEERVSSGRTEGLFVALTLVFLALSAIRAGTSGFGYLAVLFLLLSCFFLFYAVNYRTLIVRIAGDALTLRFGVLSWTVPWDTVARWYLDDTATWKLGGAGIHFRLIHRRYRVFFNFLEHPRVVLELSRRRGPVQDVVFSTRRPAEVLDAVAARGGARHHAAPAL